jgi:hypothetical protein
VKRQRLKGRQTDEDRAAPTATTRRKRSTAPGDGGYADQDTWGELGGRSADVAVST